MLTYIVPGFYWLVITVLAYYLTSKSIMTTAIISIVVLSASVLWVLFAGRKKEVSKIMDSSILIDGRVIDVLKSGFLEGQLLIPDFVIAELELIAGSTDEIKQNRGKRGLETVTRLMKLKQFVVKVVKTAYPKNLSVEEKCLRLSRKNQAALLSNEMSLNKVANLQGIKVMNINQLGNALKSTIISGESLLITIMKEGKEKGQGIGYLNDGTMVVVADGESALNKQVRVLATSVLQTAAGRMVFAKLEEK